MLPCQFDDPPVIPAPAFKANRMRRANFAQFFGDSACCQMRRTRQPSCLRIRPTSLSRLLFLASFAFQNALLLLGCAPCLGHPCQKHPSTKTATCCLGNTKSGFPNRCAPRRHPEMPSRRNNRINAISVALLPLLWTRDITCERLRLEKTSVTPGHHFRGFDLLKATASFIPQKPIKSHVEQR